MSELFIELLSEEIPYWLQKNIVEQFQKRITDVIIENNLKTKAKFEYLPLQKGDVRKTHANTKKLDVLINKKSYIKLEFGIKKFIKWFNNTYESK